VSIGKKSFNLSVIDLALYSMSQLWLTSEMVLMQPKILIPAFTRSVIKKKQTQIHDCIVLRNVNFVLTVLLKLGYELL
jgi:hypothetical protein